MHLSPWSSATVSWDLIKLHNYSDICTSLNFMLYLFDPIHTHWAGAIDRHHGLSVIFSLDCRAYIFFYKYTRPRNRWASTKFQKRVTF